MIGLTEVVLHKTQGYKKVVGQSKQIKKPTEPSRVGMLGLLNPLSSETEWF